MAGYIFATLTVSDEAAFAEYRRQVKPLLDRFGGATLVNTDAAETMEGARTWRRLVCVRFDSPGQARAFLTCDDYAPVKALRDRCAVSEVVVVEGEG